jgi:hypothetical protein
MTYHSTRLTKVEINAIKALLDLSPGTRKRLVLEILRHGDALKQKEQARNRTVHGTTISER